MPAGPLFWRLLTATGVDDRTWHTFACVWCGAFEVGSGAAVCWLQLSACGVCWRLLTATGVDDRTQPTYVA